MTDIDDLPWLDDDGEPIGLLSIRDLFRNIPDVLVWDHKPEGAAGDLYIFEWHTHHWIDQGQACKATYPGLAVKLLAHPVRHRKGHWQAPYCWIGRDHPRYLAAGGANSEGGLTGSRLRSIDPDAEIMKVTATAEDDRRNRALAEERRREQQVGRKRSELARAKGPGTRARLARELARLDDAA